MCGLFGFCAHKNKKINMWKMKMLGIYNTQRGTDSCGYYYSGHLEKGVYTNKDFANFIGNKPIIRGDGPIDIFLGHTRKATFGQHNEQNAHPHLINDNYIQTHNGVIQNETALSYKYNLKYIDAPIDSLVLGNMIERNGFKVLEEYVGFAALAMTFKDKPESLFLYHGASKEYFDDELMTCERPLYILQQPEGLYYSSMINSLDAINEIPEKESVQILGHNVVYEVKNGYFTDERVEINRMYVGTKERVVFTPAKPYNSNNYNNNYSSKPGKFMSKANTAGFNHIKNLKKATSSDELNEDDIIFSEISNKLNQDLYYESGRYYGASRNLLDGRYLIDRNGRILTKKEDLSDDNFSTPEVYYFCYGAMMKDEEKYNKCKSLGLSRYVNNMGQILSNYSKYPTICLDDEYVSYKHLTVRYLWHDNGQIVKTVNEFRPKFSFNRYRIKNGKTLEIIKQ